MELATIVERGFGIAYLACGISLLINAKRWTKMMSELEKISMPIGFLTVFIGGFMIASHNIWEKSPRVIVTIIAWIALVKGTCYLTYPEYLLKLAKKTGISSSALRVKGVCVIVLALVILHYSCPCHR